MLRGIIIVGIVLLFLLGSVGGVVGSEFKEMKDKGGHFKGNVFNNGHIIVKIRELLSMHILGIAGIQMETIILQILLTQVKV